LTGSPCSFTAFTLIKKELHDRVKPATVLNLLVESKVALSTKVKSSDMRAFASSVPYMVKVPVVIPEAATCKKAGEAMEKISTGPVCQLETTLLEYLVNTI
jgi:hypothetical protein